MKDTSDTNVKGVLALVASIAMLAPLAGCASTSGATDAAPAPRTVASAATTPPDRLVNGDFEYPSGATRGMDDGKSQWTAIAPSDGTRYTGCDTNTWVKIDGFDKARFGWSSTQTDGPNDCGSLQRKAGAVEIQKDSRTGNQYAEITAAQAGTADYQDIATQPGVMYKVRLKHASLNREYLDKMRVLVGAPGHETPVTVTRVTANGKGDKVGETGDVIATRVSNTDRLDHANQWETYEGEYPVPAGQTVTRFTFECVDSRSRTLGNLIDDVEFETAYPLSYDANGGVGTTPQQQ